MVKIQRAISKTYNYVIIENQSFNHLLQLLLYHLSSLYSHLMYLNTQAGCACHHGELMSLPVGHGMHIHAG